MRKVRRGTPVHDGPALCRSCRSATLITGTRINEDFVICSELPSGHNRITFKVTECSAYENKATTTLYEFEQLAWQLRTDRAGHRVGFLSPQDMQRRKDELTDLPELPVPARR